MRHYRTDSPQSMARLIAVTLMADGAIDTSEARVLERQDVVARLGMSQEAFDTLFHEFCEDMLSCATRKAAGQLELDATSVDSLLNEIRDPKLQLELIRVMLDIVHADHCLTAAEAALVAQALKRWQFNLHETSDSAVPRPANRIGERASPLPS